MTEQSPDEFRPTLESFDHLYRGEPIVEGGPPPNGIPWDIGQAQPRLRELEALGAINGEVLDIGCGLGDNAIYLASRGHPVTALDGSEAAIEQARQRAADVGAVITFGVADATALTGYDNRFDTVIDSALMHCLDDEGRHAYAAGLHRATRPGARWFIYCFADAGVNGVITPMHGVPDATLRDVLTRNGWQVDFLGPTTYLGNTAGFTAPPGPPPGDTPTERSAEMEKMAERMAVILPLIDDGLVHLPFTVVHATRVG
ncbi:class I SAM-dependent methyltransferase [Mycobacterium sp. ACS4331]|uniref:class I SAM-dependent methyltransferase n=1 Tax=Mycobacterium sp. ACS4331 TaxID=1834121 RepID=UPI0007FFDDA4|nr:class I SAM-dependent methyltransferase [Mycobacterium sp. ACS4331]OBF29213.1 transferase [Mycobacterium sp. ACS4331]